MHSLAKFNLAKVNMRFIVTIPHFLIWTCRLKVKQVARSQTISDKGELSIAKSFSIKTRSSFHSKHNLQPGHVDAYPDLKVTFIPGRTPELFIKDDAGELVEKIDLSGVSFFPQKLLT